MKYGNRRGGVIACVLMELIKLFLKARLLRDKAQVGRGGVGVGVIGVKVRVFWLVFEKILLIILEPHVGNTKLPNFYTLYPRQ